MFGLMRAKKCGMSAEEKNFRRLHYCGTCKTIGSLYGQKSRLLLNHDAVFLAEILSALGGERTEDWQSSYQSFNCLNLPKKEMPLPLRFAATTNVVLTEFKLADQIKDSHRRRFEFASRIFSKEFLAAESLLKEWNFPLEEVRRNLATQEQREAGGGTLDELAFPTAETTAVFFAEGARLVGRRDLQTAARALGFAFGKLVYLLDAFEDYEKDFRRKEFNAVRAVFGLTEGKLAPEIKRKIVAILRELEGEITEKIYALPLAENQKTLFAARLSQNLRRKLKTELPVLPAKIVCAPKRRQAFSDRWKSARAKAGNLTRGLSWQMPLAFAFVFAFALVAPAQARETKSARECFDLSFNLMFLGAFLGSVLALPKTILMQNLSQGNLAEKEEKRQRWCDWCDCDCCCCECGGCCDNCGCDGCCDCSCD